MTATRVDLSACSLLELIQQANRERVVYYLTDDRLVVRPSRTRPDIVDALIARADVVAAFLATHRRHVWRTPPEEEEYRKKMADEMCLTLYSLPWDAVVALTIDSLASRVAEDWERHVARLPRLTVQPDDEYPERTTTGSKRKKVRRAAHEPDRVVFR